MNLGLMEGQSQFRFQFTQSGKSSLSDTPFVNMKDSIQVDIQRESGL